MNMIEEDQNLGRALVHCKLFSPASSTSQLPLEGSEETFP